MPSTFYASDILPDGRVLSDNPPNIEGSLLLSRDHTTDGVELAYGAAMVEDQRQKQVLFNLARAVAEARQQLRGNDLEVFETLIARPVDGIDMMDVVERWATSRQS